MSYVGRIKRFISRQTENFRVLLVTSVAISSIRGLGTGGSGSVGGGSGGASYITLYIRALGADPQQIGLVNSSGRIARAICGLPLGWISDRFSLKKVVVAGLMLSVIVPTAYALATTWVQAVPAMMISAIAQTLTGMFINIFFVTAMREASDRATAMSMKSILTSLVGLAIPTIATIIVVQSGGISIEGIRPLFLIQIVCSLVVLMYTTVTLKEVGFLQQKRTGQKKQSIIQDYKEIATISAVQKWTITKGLRTFFGQSLLPFYSLFYVEVKGADPIIIGAMGTIGTLGALLFLVPFGRLADKHGRKKVIYLTRPFNYLALAMIVVAPTPEWLIVAAFLRALNTVSSLMEITMEHELVSEEQRGRWGGFLSFVMGVIGIPGPILVGYLWTIMDPSLLLLTPIVADLPFLAVLPTIPDTLYRVYEPRDTPKRTYE